MPPARPRSFDQVPSGDRSGRPIFQAQHLRVWDIPPRGMSGGAPERRTALGPQVLVAHVSVEHALYNLR